MKSTQRKYYEDSYFVLIVEDPGKFAAIILQFAVVRQVRIRGHPPEPLLSYAQRFVS